MGLERPGMPQDLEPAMEELALLAKTAGAAVLQNLVQKRAAPDRACYIGPGKARELAEIARRLEATLVIFNDELSPSQVRNLERLVEVKIIDRTALILDIFARRARSREGKLQVELAQMHYILPRLIGLGSQLSRLGGGIGTRGPGETRLETDRRVIRRRIGELQREITTLRRHRFRHRQRRQRNGQPLVSLVGYTNAGKSTLLNALTGAHVHTEDKLFATLDPLVRSGSLPGAGEVLFADTVGFIHQLPRSLETAFRATLEEIAAADLLLHVVDLSHPDCLNQVAVVREHLSRIVSEYYLRELLVFNKADLVCEPPNHAGRGRLQRDFPGSRIVSAATGEGLAELKADLTDFLQGGYHRLKVYLPYREVALLNRIRRFGNVETVNYEPAYLAVVARVDPSIVQQLLPYTRPPSATKDAVTVQLQERE